MIRNRLIECFERASSPSVDAEEMQRLLTFVVVGGGPTSVEFTAELHDFLKEDVTRLYPQLWKHCRVFIVEASGSILGSFNRSLSSYVESLFKKREITVLTKTQVKSVNEHTVYFEDGQSMDFGLMVWSTGIKQTDLVSSFDSVVVSRSKQQRLLVDDYLRVLAPVKDGETHTPPHPVQSTKAVFALGDCAGHFQKPLPALAQVASQQAIYIAKVLNKEGIEAVWSKGASRPFIYNHLGSMASVGQWKGVYDSAALGESEGVIPGIRGFLAFALWRAAYLTRQVSLTNKILIPMYWFKTMLFGRDISRF